RRNIGFLKKHKTEARTSGKKAFIKRQRLIVGDKSYSAEKLEEETTKSNGSARELKPTMKESSSTKQVEAKNQLKHSARIAGRQGRTFSESK
ncbi:hypothetical protein HHI36_009199, partial [Cryptolaemus montrouzieri]